MISQKGWGREGNKHILLCKIYMIKNLQWIFSKRAFLACGPHCNPYHNTHTWLILGGKGHITVLNSRHKQLTLTCGPCWPHGLLCCGQPISKNGFLELPIDFFSWYCPLKTLSKYIFSSYIELREHCWDSWSLSDGWTRHWWRTTSTLI